MATESPTDYLSSKQRVEQVFCESYEMLARREASSSVLTAAHLAAKERLNIFLKHFRLASRIIEGTGNKYIKDYLFQPKQINYTDYPRIDRSRMSSEEIRSLSKDYAQRTQPHLY